MTRIHLALLGFGFLVGLLTGVVFSPNHEAEAKRMQAQAKGWYAVAATMSTRVDTLVVEQVKTVARVQRVTDTVLRVLREQHPECAAAIDTCSERIAAERENSSRWEGLFRNEKQVADLWRRSADTAIVAVDKAVKGRSLGYSLLHPEVRPGVFAGACYGLEGTWKPCVGGGLTLSWRF